MLGHLRSVAPGEHGEGTKDQHRWSDGLDPRFCNSSFLDFFFFFLKINQKIIFGVWCAVFFRDCRNAGNGVG